MAKKGNPKKAGEVGSLNEAMREEAHRRLDELMNMAEQHEDYGTMGIEVHFRAGIIDLVQRRLTGADKPAEI